MEDIKTNVKMYIDIFYDIAQGIMPKRNMSINPEEDVSCRLLRWSAMSWRTPCRCSGRRTCGRSSSP